MQFSRYNIVTKNGDKYIIYNTLNQALIELNVKEYNTIKKSIKKEKETDLIKALKAQEIIIDEDNELEILQYNYKCMQFDKMNLSLTICPTLDCIFRCPYCFEARHHGKMSMENQEKLINFVKENIKNSKAMDVLWFGGEPLMAFDVIEHLSQEFMKICKENNIPYTAYIISNAYLLDEEKAKKFEEYNIKGVQITIDGPKYIHDSRRVLENKVGTYDKIVENIKGLKNYDIRVNIRINIDKTNKNDIEQLFKDFEDKGLDHVKFDFGHVLDYTENCRAIACNCLDKQEFSKVITEYNQILHKYNFPRNKKTILPEPISIYCDACKKYAYNIDPNLNLYKCWNEFSDESKMIGNLCSNEKTEQNRAHERKYILWDPITSNKCKNCKYLPLCMGGCPYLGMKVRKNQCDKWKFIIKNMIKEYVKQNG